MSIENEKTGAWVELDLVTVAFEVPREYALQVAKDAVAHLSEIASDLAGVQAGLIADGKSGEARYANHQIGRAIAALQAAQTAAEKFAQPKPVMRTRSLGENNEND